MRGLALAVLLAFGLTVAVAAQAAGPCEPCAVAGGTYHIVAPPGWNGTTPLRLLLFLHGWRGKGTDITGDPHIAGVASALGFLLVAPDGAGGSWGHVGSPHRERDDVAFLLAVVADAERRWPIDMHAVVAGGFSQGGSMVWDLACYAAPHFTAFVPFSGGFWEPLPDACHSGPVNLRHTHGTHDSVVPMTGRPLMGGLYHQGDIRAGFSRWVVEDRCYVEPDHLPTQGDLTCSAWSDCASGHRLELCTQPGDHSMIQPWLEASLRWAIGGNAAIAAAP
jgi:polyhydroxybutyrate depolymerase